VPSFVADSPAPNDARPATERYFFCIGSARSGTTLLARILDQHPALACVVEGYLPTPLAWSSLLNLKTDKWQRHGFERAQIEEWRQVVHETLAESGVSPGYPLNAAALENSARGEGAVNGARNGTAGAVVRAAARVMPAILTDFARRLGAEQVGDKWPQYIEYLPLVLQVFPQARFIYTVRDPRAVWNSGQRFRGRGLGHAVLSDMLRKDLQVQAYLGSRSNFLLVRYEDLVMDTGQTAQRIFEFLGVPFSMDYLDYDARRDPYPGRWDWVKEATSPVDPERVNQWKQRMTMREIKEVTTLADWFIDRYNYDNLQH
jgi:hypothetical protein